MSVITPPGQAPEDQQSVPDVPPQDSYLKRLANLQSVWILGVLVIIVVLFSIAAGGKFLSTSNFSLISQNIAVWAVLGVGMTFVIVTAGIDLSVGAVLVFSGVVAAKAMEGVGGDNWGVVLLGLAVALAAGLAWGAINGVLIAYGRVHAIIITFGTANLFLFLGLQLFGSRTVNGIPDTLAFFGRGPEGRTLGVPHSFLITLVITALAWWYLRHTSGGRHFFAIGGDAHAARLAGVRVQRRVLLAYLVTGLLVGLASCFTIAQGTSTLDQSVGTGKELAIIAAVVIGGTSIMGGRGSVLGTLLGALLVQTVTSGVTQLGWRSQLSDLFVGIFIIVAVGADLLRARARRTR